MSVIFAIISEYDHIFLNIFISSCLTARTMSSNNQKIHVVIYLKNKLRRRAVYIYIQYLLWSHIEILRISLWVNEANTQRILINFGCKDANAWSKKEL